MTLHTVTVTIGVGWQTVVRNITSVDIRNTQV